MVKNLKKNIYIGFFVLLGLTLQGLAHVGIEVWYINLLVKDFSRYGLGLAWQEWFQVHHIATVILFVVGIIFGLWQGKFWWKKFYEKKVKN